MEENQIVNSNADGQEQAPVAEQQPAAEAATATTNAPVAQTESEEAPQAENTQPVVEQGIAQEPVAETVAAHDDFDWTIDKRNVASYSQEEKEKYDRVYENTFVQINDGEL
ncbi:MAG: hypothetical protein M3342_25235, partial [Bacteroidota bacterium]|nr:hypothetical protein [Bacteroidota bacterium]